MLSVWARKVVAYSRFCNGHFDTDMMAYFSHEQLLNVSISAYSDLNPTPLPFRFH